jgi:hypothetical protein
MDDIKSRIIKLKSNDTSINESINTPHQSITEIESYLNNKVINIYNRPWNKLEYNLKINKLIEFLENVDKENFNNNLKILSSAIKFNKIKSNNIVYNECKIQKINYKDFSNASKSNSKSVELSLSL